MKVMVKTDDTTTLMFMICIKAQILLRRLLCLLRQIFQRDLNLVEKGGNRLAAEAFIIKLSVREDFVSNAALCAGGQE